MGRGAWGACAEGRRRAAGNVREGERRDEFLPLGHARACLENGRTVRLSTGGDGDTEAAANARWATDDTAVRSGGRPIDERDVGRLLAPRGTIADHPSTRS